MSTSVISDQNDMKQKSVTSRLNDNGRIVIPAKIRKSMGLKPGDVIVMSLEDGILRIESHLARIRRIQEEFKKFATPGTLASDELIADRREEARREMEESLG
jgi:AbrB family looped-hinge helix DNA binding protein